MTKLKRRASIRSVAVRLLPTVLAVTVTACTFVPSLASEDRKTTEHVDSDHDGLDDQLEQALLDQFSPSFMIGENDCSNLPAEFRPEVKLPETQAENGTIYGQVFPAKGAADTLQTVEIHYYHLWRRDCGPHGHALDTEHVAVLVQATSNESFPTTWKALYWYAAAHEDTVCDVSQIARASTLHAEDRGAKVWISPGKHASFLNETLCQHGCGADRCEKMVPLKQAAIINLGEPGHPMNGSAFIGSSAWPLAAKMTTTNFPAEPVARLNRLPETDIAWFNAGRHPAQGVIAAGSSTEFVLEGSRHDTVAAVTSAEDSTSSAISVAEDSTGNGLQKSYRHTRHALGNAAKHVGAALHVTPKPDPADPH